MVRRKHAILFIKRNPFVPINYTFSFMILVLLYNNPAHFLLKSPIKLKIIKFSPVSMNGHLESLWKTNFFIFWMFIMNVKNFETPRPFCLGRNSHMKINPTIKVKGIFSSIFVNFLIQFSYNDQICSLHLTIQWDRRWKLIKIISLQQPLHLVKQFSLKLHCLYLKRV